MKKLAQCMTFPEAMTVTHATILSPHRRPFRVDPPLVVQAGETVWIIVGPRKMIQQVTKELPEG